MYQTYVIQFQLLPMISNELNGFSLLNYVNIQKFLVVPHNLWVLHRIKA